MAADSINDELEIPYYEIPPTYEEFLRNHLIPNKPCIIGPCFTRDWKANKEWVVPVVHDSEQEPKYKPNYIYLRKQYGTAQGQVAQCNKRHFTDQERTEMSFAEFCTQWEEDDGKPSLDYLKDLHLQKTFPDDKFYTVPNLFEDDWLNEYWLQQKGDDDYRFAYLGGHTTFTPLHADVYRSFSWSSNICGIKKWTIFPPGQEDLYKDKFSNSVYDVRDVDLTQFTKFDQVKKIVIYQKDGETVFVPSNWFHQVENIGAAISINHNWINASNIMLTYKSLRKDWNDCKHAIEDLEDTMPPVEFLQECQNLLLVHSGWDWRIFLNMIAHIVANRVEVPNIPINQPNLGWQMHRIEEVLKQWEADEPHLLEYFKNNGLFDTYLQLKSNMTIIKSNSNSKQ
ncbi:hypothetical protein INT46_010440 [Mucor plumbeus]|uniref:JmjC domain-containing protein n=1 Tax=Mucor plumbeus TaxID=97098 RepID=A0A8H7VBD6_9FUNG|nr:hypothetical protein INT46_010440 [Mucor plumbeus]